MEVNMKLTLKFVNGDTFELEFDAAHSVLDLKIYLSDLPEVSTPPGLQRLFYEEQIMEDEKTLADYFIDEKKFIYFHKTETDINAAENVDPDVASVSGTQQHSPDPQEATLLQILRMIQQPDTFNVDENLLDYITEMGFPRPEVRYALIASLNNPDLAVEILSDGLPGCDMLEQIEAPVAQPAAIGAEKNVLGFLRENPYFVRLRRLLTLRPELLPPLLLGLPAVNTELLSAIQEHPKDFLEMLREQEESAEEPAGITLTPDEQFVFDRIVEMGFPRDKAFDAFIASGRSGDATIACLCAEKEEEDE